MAKNEPNTPDDVKTAPAIETPAEEQAAPVNEQMELGGNAPASVISTVSSRWR